MSARTYVALCDKGVVMRIIGIRHRVKRTREGEARPTQVMIYLPSGEVSSYDLETETDEFDFLLGRFPVSYRPYVDGEDLSVFHKHHLKMKKSEDDEKEVVAKVPAEYEGLAEGDIVLMILGGSGDRFAFALSKRGEFIGANVYRLPAFEINSRRGERSKDEDTMTLVEIFRSNPELFYRVGVRDRDLIRVKEAFFARKEAQHARIGCGQRLSARVIGQIFLSDEGLYPDGLIEDACDAEKANDVILQGLIMEEKRRDTELKLVVRRLDVWREIFSPIKGVGETIAAGIVVAVGDIRRFSTKHKLKKFMGVHVDEQGRFPRRRVGSVANWHPAGRQSLYLLADQFNRRADSEWGMKLREIKRKLREKHPVVECSACALPWEDCKKKNGEAMTEAVASAKHTRRYTDGHIHKMAIWKTLNKFVEALYRDWWNLERRLTADKKENAA